uniref:Ig-like domain-containing protein n=1 Tax=Xenopus tropicalis TaxID=8364 RepID=A0A803JCT1_XENTR
MALSAKWLCFAFAIIFGICWAGASEEPCYGNVGDTEVYAPFGSWALFNCTHNCTKADWESRLIKRNKIDGPGWVSVEVGVGVTDKEWKASEIACTVLSRGEAVDNFVTVIPYEIPRLVTLDMEDMLEEGKSYIITCTVHGVAPIQNLRVTMLRGKELIYNKTFKDDLTRKADNITEAVTYQITAERSDNMEDFSCQATLALGTVIGNVTVPSSNVTVRTFELPDISFTVSNDSVLLGDSITASCLLNNNNSDPYGVTIRLNGEEICKDPAMDCNVPVNRRSPQSLVSCEAFIKDNTDITVRREKSLTVHYPPATPNITAVPTATIPKGGALNVTCWADGLPQPEYRWVIPNGASVVYMNNNSVIFIPEASTSHSGNYTCHAVNQHGESPVALVITVTDYTLVIILCVVGFLFLIIIIIAIVCLMLWKKNRRGFYDLFKPKQEKRQEEEMTPMKTQCNSH